MVGIDDKIGIRRDAAGAVEATGQETRVIDRRPL